MDQDEVNRRLLDAAREGQCDHEYPGPSFDPEEARGMTAAQVRERWPRFYGPCTKCGEHLIAYASYDQYLAGDW